MASPLQIVVDSGQNELTGDFKALLTGLNLLQDDPSAPAFKEKEAIQAVATNLSKWWAALTGAAGGGLSFATVVAAWKASQEATKLSLIGGASFMLGATVIAIALIVRADLAARARVTSALFSARAAVADEVIARTQ